MSNPPSVVDVVWAIAFEREYDYQYLHRMRSHVDKETGTMVETETPIDLTACEDAGNRARDAAKRALWKGDAGGEP